ncbi:alpha/beta-hydrolase [Colletotrichum zoysiae]|uniref:Alpha/beta-hydrolase n=1 Tax=Colletotrichum zoysiae TaxID=1216348 RepID=A0AAD9LZ23_9PEZI|nr:alpha/beta-hydrolase [Colletotrichum zoysiae]
MPFTVGSVEVIQVPLPPPERDAKYDNAYHSVTLLKKGHRKSAESAPFQADTIFEKDVQLTLRDGACVRADIFRPADDSEKVPALVAWSPYGKTGRGVFSLDIVPGRVGVPKGRLSGYEKFEAPDPAEWTARGYAIVNLDSRGSWDSDGDLIWWATAEGRDGYDVVEELAQLPWCNQAVSMVGNSWLGIIQWFVAAERPPHLKCIAPLEGASDIYREIICRGGVPCKAFLRFLAEQNFGRGTQEHLVSMIEKYPLMNDYWADKRAQVNNINVPIYALASYSTGLHTFGSFRGYTEAPVKEKWLRVHATQEWHDLYQQETNNELQQFLDHYTKGKDNGWKQTPKVRVSILWYNKPIVNHVFPAWPIPSTRKEKLYLCPNALLSKDAPSRESQVSYKSDVSFLQTDNDSEELSFCFTFEETAYLVGNAQATLYLSCLDHDDMDVCVQLRKTDRNGRILQQINIPAKDSGIEEANVERINSLVYLGPSGYLRASHRAIDSAASIPDFPEHDYTKQHKVNPGTIVKLEIGLWQTGIAFEAGEGLVLKVSGHSMTLAEFPVLRGKESLENVGTHHVHLGGSTSSYITIPLVKL